MTDRSSLHWFPFYPSDWLSSPAVGMMLPEQRGAYHQLLAYAWGDGSTEPSLPSDDSTLAGLSGLARRWVKLGALVRAQFVERDGRLYNARLSEVWAAQHSKRTAIAEKGRKGGKAKAQLKPGSSSALAGGYQLEPELEGELEAAVPNGTEQLLASPPADAALAPEAPRVPADYQDRPAVREALLRVGRRPDPDEPRRAPTPLAEAAADDQAWAERYAEAMAPAAEKWLASHPEEAEEIEREVRAGMLLKPGMELGPLAQQTLKSAIHRSVVVRLKWPSEPEWIALRRAASPDLAPR